jgi:hypothetical protein
MSVYVVRCSMRKVKRDRSKIDKTRAETKNDRGGTQYVKVDVQRISSGNEGEHRQSQIEGI